MSPADHSHIPAPGILFALSSALLFGASTPFAKLLLGALDPWMLAGLLYLGSGPWAGCAADRSSCHGLPGCRNTAAPRRSALAGGCRACRRGDRSRPFDDWPGIHTGFDRLSFAQPRRLGDNDDRLAGIPGECRSPFIAGSVRYSGRRSFVVLVGGGKRFRGWLGCPGDRRRMPRLGHRQ